MTADDDIDRRLSELETTLEELQTELKTSTERKPGADSFAAYAWDVGITIGLTVIEAQLNTIDQILTRLDQMDHQRANRTLDEWTDPARETGVETLDRLDTVLNRLERELERGDLPAGREASSLIAQARELSDEIETRVGESRTDPSTSEEGVSIDVESELETIRDEVDAENESDDTTSE